MLKIDLYEKQEGRCPNCAIMRGAIQRWQDENPEAAVQIMTAAIEPYAQELKDRGVKSAPYILVEHEDGRTFEAYGRDVEGLLKALDG